MSRYPYDPQRGQSGSYRPPNRHSFQPSGQFHPQNNQTNPRDDQPLRGDRDGRMVKLPRISEGSNDNNDGNFRATYDNRNNPNNFNRVNPHRDQRDQRDRNFHVNRSEQRGGMLNTTDIQPNIPNTPQNNPQSVPFAPIPRSKPGYQHEPSDSKTDRNSASQPGLRIETPKFTPTLPTNFPNTTITSPHHPPKNIPHHYHHHHHHHPTPTPTNPPNPQSRSHPHTNPIPTPRPIHNIPIESRQPVQHHGQPRLPSQQQPISSPPQPQPQPTVPTPKQPPLPQPLQQLADIFYRK